MFDVFYIGKKPNRFAHEREVKSIEEAQVLTRTRYFWIIHYLCDYSNFDFLWEPKPWEQHQRHAFASQWQKDSETYLCPKTGFTDTHYHKEIIINRKPWLNHQQQTDVYLIDHGNPEIETVVKQLENKGCTVKKRSRFINSYKGTLQRILRQEQQDFVWVCSSVCDYSDFDFSWHPDRWQETMLHVFASNDQQFGDTFLINVPSFNKRIVDTELLEWYDTLHFVDDISVKRWPIEKVKYNADTLVNVAWEHEFTSPLAYFYKDAVPESMPTVNLWREKTKAVISLKDDNSAAIIPRDAKNYLKTQVYDYPFIDKTYRGQIESQTQDIVYISYDEPESEKNYKKLLSRFPNVKRVHGVKGMENALIAAANESSTPWYFAVFAKTELEETFKFDFVPDYFQTPKHYIFNCRNRVNGLEYGHMGVILYNCNMVKNGPGYYNNNNAMSLDYTISFPTETIPLLSCHGNFDTSPYHTWRTSFREVAKLSYFESVEPTMDNQYRLKIWTTRANGPYAQWALNGAKDGIEFFNESGGDLNYMKQSFGWDWLRDRFVTKYGEIE